MCGFLRHRCAKNNAQSLWRDQAAPEGEPIILPSKNNPVVEQPTKPQVNEVPKVEPEIAVPLPVEVPPVVVPRNEVQAPVVTIASFELQAFALENALFFRCYQFK